MHPDSAAGGLAGAGFPWWIAGGWAIDLVVGLQTRTHADLDVLTLRTDHLKVRQHLAAWDVHAADPPGQGSVTSEICD